MINNLIILIFIKEKCFFNHEEILKLSKLLQNNDDEVLL